MIRIICLLMGMSGMFVYTAIITQKNEQKSSDDGEKNSKS